MKKLFSIFFISFILGGFSLVAQWEDAVVTEVPFQEGTAVYAKGVISNENTVFVAWGNTNNSGSLFFATKSSTGNWSLPELISENVSSTAEISTNGAITYIAYTKNSGANIELWLAEVKAPFVVVSNEMILSDEEQKTSLSLDVSSDGTAHMAWAMKDVASDLVRVHYYNNSENGEILGANKLAFSNMNADYNPLDMSVTSAGHAEVIYAGDYQGEQIIQRAFNEGLNSTQWKYGTYFTEGPSTFSEIECDINGNLVNYLVEKESGEIVFFQSQVGVADSWIPDTTAVVISSGNANFTSLITTSVVNKHISLVTFENDLYYSYNTSNTDWNGEIILEGVQNTGNLAVDNVGELYYIGVKSSKAFVFGPDVISSNTTIEDLGVKLFPNPSSDFVYIEAENRKNHEVVIYNVEGKLIESGAFSTMWNTNVSDWNSGVYYVQIKVGDTMVSHKLMVN